METGLERLSFADQFERNVAKLSVVVVKPKTIQTLRLLLLRDKVVRTNLRESMRERWKAHLASHELQRKRTSFDDRFVKRRRFGVTGEHITPGCKVVVWVGRGVAGLGEGDDGLEGGVPFSAMSEKSEGARKVGEGGTHPPSGVGFVGS